MRTITRDIAGAFIFSKDNKILLGKKAKGGVYEDSWVVPGGGVEKGETKEDAVRREIYEEVGISLEKEEVLEIAEPSFGQSRKTIPNSNEEVLVKMTFWDFKVNLQINADKVQISPNHEFKEVKFFNEEELEDINIGDATEVILKELGYVK